MDDTRVKREHTCVNNGGDDSKRQRWDEVCAGGKAASCAKNMRSQEREKERAVGGGGLRERGSEIFCLLGIAPQTGLHMYSSR